jgi:hypothetical protein
LREIEQRTCSYRATILAAGRACIVEIVNHMEDHPIVTWVMLVLVNKPIAGAQMKLHITYELARFFLRRARKQAQNCIAHIWTRRTSRLSMKEQETAPAIF